MFHLLVEKKVEQFLLNHERISDLVTYLGREFQVFGQNFTLVITITKPLFQNGKMVKIRAPVKIHSAGLLFK